MKAQKGTIMMAGEKMEILLDAGCVQNFRPDRAVGLPRITGLLCKALRRRDVARMLMQNVRIGSTILFADATGKYTYRLRIDAHSVCVLAIWRWHEEPVYEMARNVVYLMGRNNLLHVTAASELAVA